MEPIKDLSIIGTLPLDLRAWILKNLALELDTVRSVCKAWREAADSDMLRQGIRPRRTLGIPELMKLNPKIIEAKEPLIPGRAYRDLAQLEAQGIEDFKKGLTDNPNRGLLFCRPPKVKMQNAKGEVEEIVVNSAKAIAKLFENIVGFTNNSIPAALEDEKEEVPLRWSLSDTLVCGFSMNWDQQVNEVKIIDKKAYPERYDPNAIVSKHPNGDPKKIVIMEGQNDLAYGMMMAFGVLNERHFIYDPSKNKYTWMRFPDTFKWKWNGTVCQASVCFAASGLRLDYYCDYVVANSSVGFVCTRKSLGH
jgi:hypothetical protein